MIENKDIRQHDDISILYTPLPSFVLWENLRIEKYDSEIMSCKKVKWGIPPKKSQGGRTEAVLQHSARYRYYNTISLYF